MDRVRIRALGRLGMFLSAALTVGGCAGSMKIEDPAVTVSSESFGRTRSGEDVRVHTLVHRNGTRVRLMDLGGIVLSLEVPDRNGVPANIVLGFDTLARYEEGHPYFGAIIGRVANRIAKGTFELEGRTHRLATNNAPHHLHGGVRGFDKMVFASSTFDGPDGAGVVFTGTSPSGDEGYPGRVDVRVTYTLTRAGALRIDEYATCDEATPVNMTHHSYFNLAGAGAGTIRDHELRVPAGRFTVADDTLVPTGEIRSVEGTAFDFRRATKIGERLDGVAGGYDFNFVVDEPWKELKLVAEVREPTSGRVLEVYADKPGLQFYTGNFLDGVAGAGGRTFEKHGAFCLEPQHFPDTVHHPNFPDVILRPGRVYEHATVFEFKVR